MIRHQILNWFQKGLTAPAGFKSWFDDAKKEKEEIQGYYASALSKRADTFKSVDNYFAKLNAEGKLERVKTDYDFIFTDPNSSTMQTWQDIKELACLSLDHYGKAFIWLQRLNNKIINVWILPTSSTSIKVSKEGIIESYEYNNGNSILRIPKEEVVYLKHNYIIGNHWQYEGYPKYKEAVKEVIYADRFANEFINQKLASGGMPPMVGSSETRVSEQTWETFKHRFNELFGKFKPKFLMAEDSMQINPLEVKDIFTNLTTGSVSNDTMMKICIAFGIPPSIMTGDFSNRDTAKTNWSNFLTYTIEPIVDKFELALTKHFKQFDKDLVVTHDPYVFQDEALDLQTTDMLLRAGALTINEVRAKYGYNEIIQDPTPQDQQVTNDQQKEFLLRLSDTLLLKEQANANDELFKRLDKSTTEYSDKVEKHVRKVIASIKKEVLG